MDQPYVFLVEKDVLWANVLMQELKSNNIPCVAFPVHGAGMVLRGGAQERLKVHVPEHLKAQAEEMMEDLFAEDEV